VFINKKYQFVYYEKWPQIGTFYNKQLIIFMIKNGSFDNEQIGTFYNKHIGTFYNKQIGTLYNKQIGSLL
jgi:hypothetical protein